MNALAYYALIAVVAVLVLTPLTYFALNTRRVAAMTLQPVAIGWDLPAFSGLDRKRLRMYRLHATSNSLGETQEIRDDNGKRIGRIAFHRFEPPTIEVNGRKYRVYDQSDRKIGRQWRGRVGGESKDSIVLHADGKPVAEIFRRGGWLHAAWEKLSISRGDIDIQLPAARRHPFEFRFESKTVARVVRPDPMGLAPVTYVALASHASPEFAAGVLYLATQRR
jgi:hypothetical protein